MLNYKIFFAVLLLPFLAQAQLSVGGDVVLPNALPVCNVLVELVDASDTVLGQDLSEEDGTFQIDGVSAGTNYTLRFSKDDSYLNGVSTFDLVLTSRIVLGIDPLTTYDVWAVDVNASGAITALDMVLMRRLILQIETTLPVSVWAFDAPDTPTPDNQIELPALTESISDVSVIGVKRGDLNNSSAPNCQ